MTFPDVKREWIDRFGCALMKLEPAMSAATAAEHAAATYEGASELGPEEAAAIFAAEQAPGEAGPRST